MGTKFGGMSAAEAEPFLQSLERKRAVLLQCQSGRSGRQDDASTAHDQGIGDVIDQAKLGADEEMDILLFGNTLQTLGRVELGISKVRNGVFGVCQRCEGKISLPRLNAIPEAEYCMPCQEKVEKRDERLHREHAVPFNLED